MSTVEEVIREFRTERQRGWTIKDSDMDHAMGVLSENMKNINTDDELREMKTAIGVLGTGIHRLKSERQDEHQEHVENVLSVFDMAFIVFTAVLLLFMGIYQLVTSQPEHGFLLFIITYVLGRGSMELADYIFG